MRYIYDELVTAYGDPKVAPLPQPLTTRDWHKEKRRARARQEEVLRGMASRPDAVRPPD